MADKPKTHVRYKLTDQAMQTWNGFQWEVGVERKAPGKGELCTSGWLHVYTDPLAVVFLQLSSHYTRLWEATVRGRHETDRGLKEGWQFVRLDKELVVPDVTPGQHVRFAIMVAKKNPRTPDWNLWAGGWLSGKNRSPVAAQSAAIAAYNANAPSAAGAAYAAAYALDDPHATAIFAALAPTIGDVSESELIAIAHQSIRDEPADESF